MKINIEKVTDIANAIDAAEIGARARRFPDPGYVINMVTLAEIQLKKLRIPKSAWAGCYIVYEPPGPANAYKYRADGTYATVTRYPSGWFLTGVARRTVNSSSYGKSSAIVLHLSEGAKAAIPTRYVVD